MLEPEILKQGDESGNRMIIKYTAPASGAAVWALGIPQAWETPLGPTWCYLVEDEQLTVIDPGCHGSEQHLSEGLEYLGYSLNAVQRIVVTHGHIDHDGGCLSVVKASGAELWAHEIYGSLLLEDRWERETSWRQQITGFQAFENSETVERVKEHHRRSRQLTLDCKVTDGLRSGNLTYYYTPGHSPDELCIQFHNLMFTGDHILPQITPHPSVARSHASFRSSLPQPYRTTNQIYGLKAMLRSLLRVAAMNTTNPPPNNANIPAMHPGQPPNNRNTAAINPSQPPNNANIAVLPAHRAYYRGQFNLVGLERATEIVQHHITRCHDLLNILKQGPRDLVSLTRDHFSHRELADSNFFLALTEVISHLELLQETGDITTTTPQALLQPNNKIHWNGTESFPNFITNLAPQPTTTPHPPIP